MDKTGPDFYDNEEVFRFYMEHRAKTDTPNETLEQPILWELIGDPRHLKVLDLGCGDARVAKKFKALKAREYLGIDGSKRMVNLAVQNVEPGFSEVQLSDLENCVLPNSEFDLVISSLAFHYIDDLELLFKKIHSALKPGAKLVFSVEHPVLTSNNQSLEKSPIREAWLVDNYFIRGKRSVKWMGDTVTKYHRTIEDYIKLISKAGFAIENFRESEPNEKYFNDQALLERRKRIPLFLILSAKKNRAKMRINQPDLQK